MQKEIITARKGVMSNNTGTISRRAFYGVTLLSLALLLPVFGCVTINVVFPAAEVREAAEKIVEDVREKKLPKEQVPPQSFRWQRRIFIWQLPTAFAAVNVNLTTPAIRKLESSLKKRFPQLRPYFDRGVLGETNNGLVEIRSLSGLPLREQGKVRRLVKEENRDRQALYAELAKANNLSPATIPKIQAIFAESWQKAAESGWWIQTRDGKWIKKP
ncbi:MAG: DUF1318 domain-containing protein [Nitrospinota bacterium]|nr:MAG: DUF1318 domain-containing protein [Nitrospinota bacterium]